MSALSEPGSLSVQDLSIAYPGAGVVVTVPNLEVAAGSTVAIAGPSGTGKTSLLHALAGLERPTSGSVRWGDASLWTMPDRARERWRRERLGLVFQDMHLLLGLSALDNVLLPALFDQPRATPAQRTRAAALLDTLGIAAGRRDVAVMSRGERQRVALARALLRAPSILLADEPTASLDPATGRLVADLLVQAATERGATLIITTHDPALTERMGMRMHVSAGQLEQAA